MSDPPFDKDLLFGAGTGSENVRILSFAPEGVPITRADVQTYQSQLLAVRHQANSQIAKPLIGLLSSVDNPLTSNDSGPHLSSAPVQRAFGLSDEGAGVVSSRTVAGIDKGEIEAIMSKLHFDTEPIHRPWSNPHQQLNDLPNFFNYGLNPHLLREYIEAQIALRIEKSRRTSVKVSEVSGNTENAFMRPIPQPVPPVPHAPAHGGWGAPPPAPFQQAAVDDPWRV